MIEPRVEHIRRIRRQFHRKIRHVGTHRFGRHGHQVPSHPGERLGVDQATAPGPVGVDVVLREQRQVVAVLILQVMLCAHRAHVAALVQTAVFLPMFLLSLPAGVLADVTDRRRLLVAALATQAALVTVLTLLLLAIIGGAGWSEESSRAMEGIAAAHGLPVLVTWRRQNLFDNGHPHYAGELGYRKTKAVEDLVRSADLVLAIGAELGEITTGGYSLLEVPVPRQRLVHVHPSAVELSRVYHPTLGIESCVAEFIAAFEQLANLATKAAVEGKQRLKIHTPLIQMTKAQIIRRGLDLGVDYSLTSSCYDPDPAGRACGRCDSCLLRLKGFLENGVRDPIEYVGQASSLPET